jgi:KUP system potassium uptake protein
MSEPALRSSPPASVAHADAHAVKQDPSYQRKLALAALGVVYGDIGTSPLYAMRECFHKSHGLAITPANVLGILSLIFWSLIIVVSIKYLLYVLRADNKGEGGILAMLALVNRVTQGQRSHALLLALGVFGATLLYGDGMITPAITVLGAVEGLGVAAPGLERFVIPITICILIGLFMMQRRGTGGLGAIFGPINMVWFLTIAGLGLYRIVGNPEVAAAVNPLYAATFFASNGLVGVMVLASVFLVVTGSESL